MEVPCPTCHGQGSAPETMKCAKCEGTGLVDHLDEKDVTPKALDKGNNGGI